MSDCSSRIGCILSVLAALACASCGDLGKDAAMPEVWRFAIEEAEGSVQHEYALEFKRRIEKASGGRIDVVIYPYGALGTSAQTTEQLNMGVLEFAMASPGTLGKYIPELQVFLLPFVFSENDRVNKQILSDPKLVGFCDSLYAKRGLKLLSLFPEGEMVWTTNREIRSPEDFRGVKMRVMTSPILLAAYEAFGASATPMPYSEVYSALQLNMIDGQVNPVFAIERQKFYEVTDWMIFPKHAHFITTAAANRRFFDRLSPERKQMVLQTMADLEDYIFEVQVRFQTDRLKTILREKQRKRAVLNLCGDFRRFRGTLSAEQQADLLDDNPYVNITPPLTDEERDTFRKRSLAVREVFLEIGGPRGREMLDRILNAVARAEQGQGGT